MFFPVHVATGAVIDKASGEGRWRKWLLVAPLAFLTHPLLDYFNGGDSGSSNILFHGPMNGTLNAIVISMSVVFGLGLAFLARRYWVGMVFGCLPDVEHGFFMFTGMDESQGLHGKLFWLPVFSTEWGLLIQLGLFGLVAAIVLLPRERFAWRWSWRDARARIKLPSLSLRKAPEYSVQGRWCPLCAQAEGTWGRLTEEVGEQAVQHEASRGVVTAVLDEQTARACRLHAETVEIPIGSQATWGERQHSQTAREGESSVQHDGKGPVEGEDNTCLWCLVSPQQTDESLS